MTTIDATNMQESSIHAEPTLRIERTLFRNESSYRHLKRGVDICGATALGFALLPCIALVALAVKLTSKGPVIFRQKRLTEGGREFTLYKFRTMRVDAERDSGATLAREKDDRVTSIGRILRKTRLDELPQLLNVIKGEMSLIGPRPERPELAVGFAREIKGFHKRLGTKAGLTGLAQVIQGYPDFIEGYRQKVAFDRLYIRKQSLALDAWIALKTIGIVMSGSGAR